MRERADHSGQIPELDPEAATGLGSLVAIGIRSGATVVGLSAVRRARGLAYVLVDGGVAEGTRRELALLQRRGTQVLQVESLQVVSRAFGREDIRVLGIKRGDLAQGIAARLVSVSS